MRKRLLIATLASLVTLGVNGVIYSSNRDSVSADEVPPIVQQVNEHEERIGDLEDTTENIQEQVTENKTSINNVRERTVVVEKQVQAPAPTPTPAPRVLQEMEITRVRIDPKEVRHPETGELVDGFICSYDIHTITRYTTQYVSRLDNNCQKVGEIYTGR